MSDANVSLPDPVPPPAFAPPATARARGDGFWGKDGLSFGNLIDVINPLQHIPVVGSIYRAVTGDQISPGARLVGGTLFGGPIGFAASVANLVAEDVTGTDLAKTAVAMVRAPQAVPEPPAPAQFAAASPAAMPADAAPAAAGASEAPHAMPQLASAVVAPRAMPVHAPAPWSALTAPAQLMPPSATPGNIAGVVSPVQKDALFARLAGESPSALPAAATADAATPIDAARKDAIFARLAGESAASLPSTGAPSAAEVWRPTTKPKMSAPIRPKLRGAPVAGYMVAPRPTPAAAAAAETQALAPSAAAAAAPARAAPAGGYTAQELLQMYQRYQNPGFRPASGAADANS